MMQLGWLPCDIQLHITQLDWFIMRLFHAIAKSEDNMNSFVKLIGPCSRYLFVVLRRLGVSCHHAIVGVPIVINTKYRSLLKS